MSTRHATESDLEAIRTIYNHAVASSTASFDLEPRTAEAEQAWFNEHQDPYAVIVWEQDGVVAAWGSIGQAMIRAAHGVTGDLSVYVRAGYRRRGVGEAILRELVTLARARGFHSVTAFISGENAASLAMVEKLGFIRAAWLAEIGRKFDRWLSVAIYQLFL